MDHWPWYIRLLWWSLWGSDPLSPLCQNFLYWFCDQWCYSGQIWGMGPLMFLEPLSKSSEVFPYIFLITLHPVTFVPIDDSTLFHERIFVLGSHQEALDGIASFKIYLNSIFLACSLEAFTQPFIIWHHYVVLFLVASHAALVFLLVFMGWCFHSYLYPVECPNRVFTFCQDFLQMLLFFQQQLRAWACGVCPVVQGAYHTVSGTDSMMAVPLHVQVCMCKLPKDRCGNASIYT